MIDIEVYGILGYIAFIILIVMIRIVAVFVVAGAIAAGIGLEGILWWCSSIVIFLLINAIITGLHK